MASGASERVGEGREPEGSTAGRTADVQALLIAYNGAQALIRRPPASISLPARNPWRGLLLAVHLRVRPTWFAERWMARELRRRAGVMERGMAERLALGGEPTLDEVRDRDALRHFQESLTPRLSGFVAVVVFIGALVLAQSITNGLLVYQYEENGGELATALGEISVTPDASAISTLVKALGDADLSLLFAFVMGLCASGYIVGRAPASGYRLARLTLGERDGLGIPRRASALSRAVAALRLREAEATVFGAVDRPRPRELPLDLAVKALMAVGWLFVAIFSLRGNADPRDYWEFILFAALASLRLLWLGRASLVRGAGVAWLAVPLVVLVAGAMMAAPEDQDDFDYAAANPELSLMLTLQRDLSGVDLRERDLSRFHLPGKDLRRANLSDANLDEAQLTGATLRDAYLNDASLVGAQLEGADLRGADMWRADLSGASLRHADLRRANLWSANLESADLCGADLRGATLNEVAGRPYYGDRTRWPSRFVPPPHDPHDFGC